ncbi:hypothetical protein HMPREF1624_03224 [Sporothrix schenckii ATCC 58251]|uniref:BZIP domain-containing protein n=1 Tax=Sporothrix schenckii (strain ATCC 58251 / de Perez 2211183) TaxID=1391915 RepID=U7PYQ4_SPOS1|nr:hypothetical protein HMPREF1624_03224 [Sporothrix schenckii ATCC 58251]
MASLMDSSSLPAAGNAPHALSASLSEPESGVRSAGRTGPASGKTKGTRGAASAANKPVKASKTKTPNGANSEHRKEQNRIASRNYREKRKHKLALLQQILYDPSASDSVTEAAAAASTPVPAPAPAPAHTTVQPAFGPYTDGTAPSLADSLDELTGILPDFQPIISGLISSNMLPPETATTSDTAAASIDATAAAQEAQPSDDFAAWAASNLPAAIAANSPRAKSSATPPSSSSSTSASASRSTKATVPTLSTSSATTSESLLDLPMLQPWLIPFSSDQNSFTPFLTNATPNNGVTSSSFSAFTPADIAAAVAPASSTPKARSQPMPSGSTVLEVDDLDETFDPGVDVDQFMTGTDSHQQHGNGVFSSLLSRPDWSTSYYAAQSYQNLHGTFASGPQPTSLAGAAMPLPQPTTRPSTTTLPSRPSPRPLSQTLAPPSAAAATSSPSALPPNVLPSAIASPAAVAGEPSRKTRKKNRPVVRAMLQYVQTLSPHQKRLILQALLDGEGGGGSGGEGEGADGGDGTAELGDGDDERVEEVENAGDDSDGSNDGTSNTSGSGTGKGAPKKTAFISRREDRFRQVVARWNNGRFAGPAGGGPAAGTSFSSSSSSPFSGTSTTDAASYAALTLSSYDRPNGLTSAIHNQPPPSGIYGTSFGADPMAGSYFPVPVMYMNLQCRRMGFRAAVWQNCLACGLANPDALFDEAACYDEELEPQSPFALQADEARAVVLQGANRITAAVTAVRQNLARAGKTPPRDLQPVDAQILVAHHPYLDVIPFRGFRARALALLAEMEAAEEVAAAVAANNNADGVGTPPGSSRNETPCLLDEDELCYDMNVAEGLVCWGSQTGNDGAGLSSQAKRDSGSARDMRACLPWDMRSWEPQVWFLKKYWFLVGGWDDDMWRNCRWWHSMRGDELDYSVFALPGY